MPHLLPQASRQPRPSMVPMPEGSRDQPYRIYRDLGPKFSIAIFVTIGRDVVLFCNMQRKIRKPQPSRSNSARCSNRKTKSPDRQRVCRGTEVKIDIDTAIELSQLRSIVHPAAVGLHSNLMMDKTLIGPTVHEHQARLPIFIAAHLVVQQTRRTGVFECRRAGQEPAIIGSL